MAAFDAEIGMWTVPDSCEDRDAALAREAQQMEMQDRAKAVAQAVADEVAAMQWSIEPEGATDWVAKGSTLLDEITRFGVPRPTGCVAGRQTQDLSKTHANVFAPRPWQERRGATRAIAAANESACRVGRRARHRGDERSVGHPCVTSADQTDQSPSSHVHRARLRPLQ